MTLRTTRTPFTRRTARLVPLAVAIAGTLSGCSREIVDKAQAAGVEETASVTVKPRDFVRRLRLTGLTEATQSYVVTTPLLAGANRGPGSLVIIKLAPAGRPVRTGDLLVQFDSQEQDKTALEKKAEYEELLHQIRQKNAEQASARIKDDSELAQARNAVKNFELETLKNEMLSRVLAEKNNQDLAEAKSKVAALEEAYDLKRTAAHAELRILEIRRDRAKAAMDHALENSKGMVVTSPLDGLVVPKLTWRGNGPADIQEGDEMRPGGPVLQVVNQASMQVRARVNQADAPIVRGGMPVTVRLDAYPDIQMPGKIEQVAPIGVPGSFSPRLRAFVAIVSIVGSNSRLLPDLTAAIDVDLEHTKGALVVPWSAVTREGERATVRVRGTSGVDVRPVTLGPSDEVDVVVTSGLTAGDVVLK